MLKHHKWIHGSIAAATFLLITACSGGSDGSSSDDADSASGEEQSADEGSSAPPELTLDTSSRKHAVHLAWTGADTVDIYFSTDPECDWDAYGSCPGSGLITNVEGQDSLLSAPEDGLLINRAHWFVVAADDRVSSPVPGRPWVPSPGTVTDLHLHDNVLYVGGFSNALAAQVGGIALFNEDHHLSGQMPWSSGTVYGATPDGHGGYFYYGSFDWFMGEPRTNISHLDEYGRLTDWSVEVDNSIEEVLVVEDTVYVAGNFTEVNGDPTRQYMAAVDRVEATLKSDWQVLFNDNVTVLAADGDRLYVGGSFDEVNTEPSPPLIAVDRHSGGIDNSWSVETADGYPPIAMILMPDKLILAGEFDEINDEPWAYLAAVDLDSGALIEDWGARPNGTVETLSAAGDRLYVGGRFDLVNGHPAYPYLAALDLTDGTLDYSWIPEAPGQVEALLARGDQVYVGFDKRTPEDEYVRVYDAATADFDPDARFGLSHQVTSLTEVAGAVAFAGSFDRVLPEPDTGLVVALDPATGRLLEGWHSPLIESGGFPASTFFRLAVTDDHVYLSGFFDSVNGHNIERLVRLDRLTGEPDLSWQFSINGPVRELLIAHGRLYIGGDFDTINGETVYGLGAINLSTGLLNESWIPELSYSGTQSPRVDLIESDEFHVIVAGRFDKVNGESHPGLVAIDEEGDPRAGFSASELDITRLYSLQRVGDLLFLGGSFVEVDGEERLRLAAIDVSTGELQTWRHDLHPEYSSYQGFYGARAFELHDDVLYVGGRFEGTEHTDQNHLIALTAATGDWVDWQPPDIDTTDLNQVRALLADDDWVYVGGSQLQIAGYPGRNLVVFSNASQGSEASIRW